jgi:hypothetical protein
VNVCSQQLSSLQTAAVNAPAASHDDFPDTMYPSSHVGWHVVSPKSWSVQLPTAPLAGGVDASHEGMQTAGDRTLFSHTLGPDTAYPWSHVG